MKNNKLFDVAGYKRDLYDALVKSYNTDKDIFESYAEVFSLKRSRDDKYKDQDPSVGSNQRTKKGNQVKMLCYSEIQGQRKRSPQAPLNTPLNVNVSLLTSLPMQRSQVILLKTRACNKIKSLSRETMMNNPFTRRLPKLTGSRNLSDLQLLILIGVRENMLTFDLLKPGLVKLHLTNITIDEWYDLNVALRMYTRCIVIQSRVEDLQLGVESYQKKLNLVKPDTYISNLRNKTTYTSFSYPHGLIYMDWFKRKRLMRANKLHKFSDGTLNDVWTALHDIAARIRMEYMPMRKYSNLDKKRARVMVQNIDKQLYQRRLMRNLEKFVGGRVYENDLRLLERTI
nr:hypothetical protein [Tanacetum cinerariifolium]